MGQALTGSEYLRQASGSVSGAELACIGAYFCRGKGVQSRDDSGSPFSAWRILRQNFLSLSCASAPARSSRVTLSWTYGVLGVTFRKRARFLATCENHTYCDVQRVTDGAGHARRLRGARLETARGGQWSRTGVMSQGSARLKVLVNRGEFKILDPSDWRGGVSREGGPNLGIELNGSGQVAERGVTMRGTGP